ncbi:MAG: putative toxin-antitoxin system toxin component, PIN family [Promethearchaeia archaeon]
MIRVFIDTNVFISAYFWNGNERNLVKIKKKGIEYFTSQQVLDEIKKVLKEKFNVDDRDVSNYLSKIYTNFNLANPDVKLQVFVRDHSDTNILKSALSARCQFLVTGDKDLLDLKKVKETRILNSVGLIDALELNFPPEKIAD